MICANEVANEVANEKKKSLTILARKTEYVEEWWSAVHNTRTCMYSHVQCCTTRSRVHFGSTPDILRVFCTSVQNINLGTCSAEESFFCFLLKNYYKIHVYEEKAVKHIPYATKSPKSVLTLCNRSLARRQYVHM